MKREADARGGTVATIEHAVAALGDDVLTETAVQAHLAPLFSRVVVVGVCMGTDQIRPAMAINKEIDLRFVVGYTPVEFRDTLHMLAEGNVNAAPLLTGVVGLDGVKSAFAALADPDAQAKVLIDPKSSAVTP